MAEVIKEVTTERLKLEEEHSSGRRNIQTEQAKRDQKEKKQKKSIFEIWQAKKEATAKHTLDKRKSKLGQYLLTLAQVAEAMDYEADEQLLRENLYRDPPLHIRRTLDQSYFWTMEDTSIFDKAQVVHCETRASRSFHSRNARVVMVDQLWLWILDNSEYFI
jgi:IS1 family transposase